MFGKVLQNNRRHHKGNDKRGRSGPVVPRLPPQVIEVIEEHREGDGGHEQPEASRGI